MTQDPAFETIDAWWRWVDATIEEAAKMQVEGNDLVAKSILMLDQVKRVTMAHRQLMEPNP